jgi:hypothetical protein
MTLATLMTANNWTTGSERAPHFIFKRFKVRDNAICCFRGAANVSIEHMVDLEDVQNDKPLIAHACRISWRVFYRLPGSGHLAAAFVCRPVLPVVWRISLRG